MTVEATLDQSHSEIDERRTCARCTMVKSYFKKLNRFLNSRVGIVVRFPRLGDQPVLCSGCSGCPVLQWGCCDRGERWFAVGRNYHLPFCGVLEGYHWVGVVGTATIMLRSIQALLSVASVGSHRVQFTGILAFGMAFYSIFSVVRAFNRLDARTDDVRNTISNWEKQPLMEVRIVHIDSDCPGGFQDMTTLPWRGTSAGPCACPQGASQRGESEFSSSSDCDSNQTRAGCESDPGISAIDLIDWREEHRVCGRRDGESSIRVDGDEFIERPLVRDASGRDPSC